MAEEEALTERQHSQQRRARNRVASEQILRDAGVTFTVHNQGAHIVVRHYNLTVDFWPGTGLWIVKGNLKQRRGVHNLIKFLKARS